jgi:hypothetical protein
MLNIFANETIDEFDISEKASLQLTKSAAWAAFTGKVYLGMGIFTIMIAVLTLLNIDLLGNLLQDMIGMQPHTLETLLSTGKWLFVLMTTLIATTFFINAYFLMRFQHWQLKFQNSPCTIYKVNMFIQLGNYFVLTAILALFSTLSHFLVLMAYAISPG